MDGEAVKELATRFRSPETREGFILRPNDWVADDPAALIKPGPLAAFLKVSTLGAVRDYIAANKDGLDLSKLVVHVGDAHWVQLYGPLAARSRARESFVQALAVNLADGFLGKYMPIEEFIVGLQVRFADADDRKRLLSLLSNVKHETVKSAMDDGMTQIVQARAGVALVSDVAVPNPVTLCPYRTFRDIVQPSSPFVLRVASGKQGGLPEVALFEGDGGAWRLTAIERVRTWLTDALPADVSVLA